ncbi:hypothetical protein WR25_26807 [Diploscapter pachys]|uniref:Large ribosomal subunit protein eL13 n=1 Tax=Diploscapter pachys TaxID=2018661 RepID=A0A2A2KL24_9BILA|nr:hypothetical protein WR25_26807 [Diploscapter pachys]
MTIRGNQMLFNPHFLKHWARHVKIRLNQPDRKLRRSNNCIKKAAAVAFRSVRPVVRAISASVTTSVSVSVVASRYRHRHLRRLQRRVNIPRGTQSSHRTDDWGVDYDSDDEKDFGDSREEARDDKVTKITFSHNGKQNTRCHNKIACDVRFLGHSASVLLTAGCSSLDQNLGLWDTLLPQNKALVHTWACHPEGAQVALYLPNQQDLIVVGSSEGDLEIWSADSNPPLMYALPREHAIKSGFSFRQDK